jgi:hypothetical protein
MAKSNYNHRKISSVWVLLVGLCCVLVTFASVLQVEHIHFGAHPDCAACHAAHTTIAPPAPQTLPVAVWIVAALIAVLPIARARYYSCVSLYIRPPPVDIAFA